MWIDLDYSEESFDQDLLWSFTCDNYVLQNPEEVHAWEKENKLKFDCFTYTDAVGDVIDPLPKHLPQDLSLGGVPTQKCLHFTYVFQAFVFMQIFNQINARKLEEGEMNVFEGMFRNMLFIWITIFTFVIQMAMVEYGGVAVKSYPLDRTQNMICLVIGGIELIVGFILKFIPLKFFQCISLDERPASEVPGNSL